MGSQRRLPHSDNPGIAEQAVEELLRYLSIVMATVRTATEDVELDGHLIRVGESVTISKEAGQAVTGLGIALTSPPNDGATVTVAGNILAWTKDAVGFDQVAEEGEGGVLLDGHAADHSRAAA